MDAKELRKLAEDPRFIEGIYNYCDRWCERCPFTARCLAYATSEEQAAEPGAGDVDNATFWEQMQATFELAKQMIAEMAAERGIDLAAIDAEAETARRRRRKKKAKADELARQSFDYTRKVDKWFKAEEELFEEKKKDLLSAAELALPGRDPVAEAQDINDAAEVIRWYQPQIYVKLMRALTGAEDEDEEEAFPRDSDGSAKVALIGIDRSIAAWARLQQHFPEKADAILDLLVPLDRLRRRTEAKFPKARAFKRPGFDDA